MCLLAHFKQKNPEKKRRFQEINTEMESPFKSTALVQINYEFLDPPPWRNKEEDLPSAEKMIHQIIDYQKTWSTLKTKMSARHIQVIQERFREKYCDINTDPLKNELEQEKKEREANNLKNLLAFLDETKDEEGENQQNRGLIEKSIVQDAHRIAVAGINIDNGHTKPGKFSNQPRFTTYKGEKYWYRQPDDMEEEVNLILDRFNSLIFDAACKTNKRQKLKSIFKSLAYFLFEILDLHPFGNGNGRLFRSFCYYVMSSLGQTVVPSPIYYQCDEIEEDDHSACNKPCKDCYEQVLVNARKSDTRYPEELATMLIESCWRTWGEFIKEIQSIPGQ